MNLYLSHSTALRFWRAWSAAAAVPLHAFHDLGAAEAALFPDRFFAASGVLFRSACTDREIREALRGAGALGDPSAASAAEKGADPAASVVPAAVAPRVPAAVVPAAATSRASSRGVAAATAPGVPAADAASASDAMPATGAVAVALRTACCSDNGSVHVVTTSCGGLRNSTAATRHRIGGALPRGSFLKVAPGVFVCSPELVFVQMAASVPRGALLALGYELCGCYPVGGDRAGALVRRPLTAPRRLSAFAARATGLTGVTAARAAAKQVLAKSGSIMETEVSIVAFSSVAQGGLGLVPPKLNEPVMLSARAKEATGLSRVVCDWLWPEARVAVEYDGRDSHASPQQQARDARKRDALRIDGFDLTVITSSQFHHVTQCTALLLGVGRRVGPRKRKLSAEHVPRHLTLRKQVRAHHREHFPFRFKKSRP